MNCLDESNPLTKPDPGPAPHPLEPWLLQRAAEDAAETVVGPRRFDELNVCVWLMADRKHSKRLWEAYKKVALDLLDVCVRRGVITRSKDGWCHLAEQPHE